MKKLFLSVAAIGIIGLAIGLYFYNKKPADTRTEDADFQLTAQELYHNFSDDEQAANKKFLDKIIVVSGSITDIKNENGEASVFLDASDPLGGITCSFYADEAYKLTPLKVGQTVYIKGKCTGKLMDVVLNNCSLINQNNSN